MLKNLQAKIQSMNHYYAIDNEEGLRFLTPQAYANFIMQDVDATHRNLGDFYTQASLADIADVAYNRISTDLDVNTLEDQVTVYILKAHEEKENPRNHYESLAIDLVGTIASEEKKGELQLYVDYIHEKVGEITKDLKSMNKKVETVHDKLKEAFRD
jgi:hypothetical protein